MTGATTLGSGAAKTPWALTARGGARVEGQLLGQTATLRGNVAIHGSLEVLRSVVARY